MTDDLVKRLRQLGSAGPGRISFLASEDATKAADRIEKLEAALRELSDGWPCCSVSQTMRDIAREALEGKDG